jgi:hypothetical protein
MTDDQASAIPCAVCGEPLHLRDVVIVSREVVPAWVSHDEHPTAAIAHKGCELGDDRADTFWTRDAPQTLFHALAAIASRRDPGVERGRA